ncbi:hypothetical protein [Desulfobacter latus]|uniref:Uncharacterized protein n=1 Tax=Desulfobacter latus TaxID=2292 RepID=A0A850T712_9BACT|nr:hypothetical protein [Desulfobacter latus]NWH04805.1 hypothetical protein [Desulfobacter latus]
MIWNKNEQDIALPDWFEAELETMQVPDSNILERFDHLKKDFLHAARRSVQQEKRRQSAFSFSDAVISVKGKILDTVEGIAAAMTMSPGPVMARGITDDVHPSPSQRCAMGKISRVTGTHCMEITTLKEQNRIKLEVNLTDSETGVEVRPFTLTVQDNQGNDLIDPLNVGKAQMPPKLPDPSPGYYVFTVLWNSGQSEMRIEIKD